MGGLKISIVTNLDTRPGFMENTSLGEMGKGTAGPRSMDFFTHGIRNKIKLFEEYDREMILFIDVHEPVPQELRDELAQMHEEGIIDTVVFSRHMEFVPKWNCHNIFNALMLARGDIVVHFDGDTVGFKKDRTATDMILDMVVGGQYDYVSYPSHFSPRPDPDPGWDYHWASTRFFMCKRETINLAEVYRCMTEDGYLYGKYGKKYRACPWLEHILGIIAGPGRVFYPPINHQFIVFSWAHYHKGVQEHLNQAPFDRVLDYIAKSGNIQYPCDVKGRPL